MATQIIIGVFLGALGILFALLGDRAIRKKKITLGEPEISYPQAAIFWPGEKTHTGRKAVIVGWCFVILGIVFILITPLSIIDIIG